MTLGGFSLAMLRLAAIAIPAWLVARNLHTWLLRAHSTGRPSEDEPASQTLLAQAVLTLATLLVAAESLGLLALDRAGVLIAVLWSSALLSRLLVRDGSRSGRPRDGGGAAQTDTAASAIGADPLLAARSQATGCEDEPHRHVAVASAVLGVIIVSAQWSLQTADSLGSGMLSFDSLWYHMPFAARFAQSGSVTAIHFTQADPFVAYYPANAELFHALALLALHGDFLSPLINLLWLALALLAAWCVGRPWRVQPLTLLAGCLVLSLPVLSATQPGQAFNDVTGLACLMAGAALLVNAPRDKPMLIVTGLALGLAVGTKLTFLVPALCLVIAVAVLADGGRRSRALAAVSLPLALTGGWWYLRSAIATGNPLGLSLRLGALRLAGPRSPLAEASEQTVVSQIGHASLWASRFVPGLDHAFGPLWPLMLALCLVAIVAGLLLVRDERVHALALAAAFTGSSYLALPTGATGIQRGTDQFAVNLRYATPALILGMLLIAPIVRMRAPRLLKALGPAALLCLLVAQAQRSLWPTQPARHAAFLAACAVAGAAALLWVRAWRGRAETRPRIAARSALLGATLLIAAAVAFAAQRHYYARRYLTGDSADPALGAIYRWAQGVAHARIALYGTVEQYPLYGARDTNTVDYLGAHAARGGYRPIATCPAWRRKLNDAGYRYVVLSSAPTRPTPIAWTAQDPAARLILHPAADYFVFELAGRSPTACA